VIERLLKGSAIVLLAVEKESERVVEMCTVDTEYSSLEERETGRGLGLGSERGMGRGREQD
jgi:hypothetical protein